MEPSCCKTHTAPHPHIAAPVRTSGPVVHRPSLVTAITLLSACLTAYGAEPPVPATARPCTATRQPTPDGACVTPARAYIVFRSEFPDPDRLKPYGRARLEAACARALTHGSPHYRTVKTILATGADQRTDVPAPTPPGYGRTRFTRPATELFADLIPHPQQDLLH